MDPRIEKVFKLPLYQRVLLLCLLLAVIGAGFYFLLYAPKMEELANLRNQEQSLRVKLQESRRIANDLPRFKAEYERLQQELEKALVELPNKKEIPSLLTNISTLAKEQGLEILLFRPLAEVNKGFYAEVPVDMRLLGGYHDIAMFFYEVGQLSRIVNIGNLTIENAGKGEGKNLLRVDCRATTFRFVEEAKAQGGKK